MGRPFLVDGSMRVYQQDLALRTVWTVSHGTSRTRTNVFLEIDGGIGEAPIVPYYPHDASSVIAWLQDVAARRLPDPSEPPFAFLDALQEGPPPARDALDVALHDRWARNAGRPLFEMLGLSRNGLPTSSITLSIPADDDSFRRGLDQVASWPLLKLKLGSGDVDRDRRLLHLARSNFEGELCVDANGGWDVESALSLMPALADAGVIFVEEPVAASATDAWVRLRDQLPPQAPALVADESVQTVGDVHRLAGLADAINVKLAKSGGIAGALRLIQTARIHGMKVLLGCMVESSVGVTAAAHLAALADWADLDGHLHIANDPFRGVVVDSGRITLPDGPGLGLSPAR